MGYRATVSQARFQQYFDGDMDANDMIVFMQDLIEANFIPAMCVQADPCFEDYARHYVEQGLCHISARATH